MSKEAEHNFNALAANRKDALRAKNVAIHAITKAGTVAKSASTHVPEHRVEETIARMRDLNPGRDFVAVRYNHQ